MHRSLSLALTPLFLAATLLLPATLQAQSAIAGVARDASGAVVPGVTVEVSSPALIERVRTAITNDEGQYRVVDLRPGTYEVVFTLPGFSTLRREGIVLEANFTANVNAEMRVGALEETITVSGEAPVVDVQTTQRREVLTREVLDSLPAARYYATNTVPAVSVVPDVGGSSSLTQPAPSVYGSTDNRVLVDGMSQVAGRGTGTQVFRNYGSFEEVVYQLAAGDAEVVTGGVTVLIIPRSGGNEFKGDAVGIYGNGNFQGSNYSDELRTRGLGSPAALHNQWDVNVSQGGPITRNKLWFFTSVRSWAYNNVIADAFFPDGTQAFEKNRITALTGRLTYQLSQRNKITGQYDRMQKFLQYRDLVAGTDPQATHINTTPVPVNGQVKWTSTASNRLLIEAGFAVNTFQQWRKYQPEVQQATCFTSFDLCAPGTGYGDIAKLDLITDRRWNAHNIGEEKLVTPARWVMGSISYVTGAHALKTGLQWGEAWQSRRVMNVNGDLLQQYRNGVPDSVVTRNSPNYSDNSGLRTDMDFDIGLFVQDSWTMGRLTLKPGVRYDHVRNSIPEQRVRAGRFVGARQFAALPGIIDFSDVSPRFGVAYDLFGNGTTAVKGSLGRYPRLETTETGALYNPLVDSTDSRTWRDLNGDDVAQENELGPSTNTAFGVRRNRNPDPDLQRPYDWFYNLSIQRELRRGVGLSASYVRRTFGDIIWTDNLATTHADYALITIPDPRSNGQTLPVYNLSTARRGLVNELDTNTDNNTRTYDGVDLSLAARFTNGAVTIGTSSGRIREVNCEVDDPNGLRFCDQTQLDIPFRNVFKAVASYRLPYGVRVSTVFQSLPGLELPTNYIVNRTIVPTLTLASVTIRLDEPGSQYRDRTNQLDVALGKEIRLGRVQLQPKLELFNLLNVNPVLAENTTFGSSLGRPTSVLPARMARINVQVDF